MISFSDAVTQICSEDDRFHPDAYAFLKDALDHTVKEVMEEEAQPRHVNGAELMHGFRRYTLNEFGPMSRPLLKEWGITKTRDIGDMVFNLIGAQVFSKEEGDKPSDFDAIYSFKDAFDTPFRPSTQ